MLEEKKNKPSEWDRIKASVRVLQLMQEHNLILKENHYEEAANNTDKE